MYILSAYSLIIRCYIYDSIGTMSIHQIITSETGKISYRDISCFCKKDMNYLCNCYSLKHFVFTNDNASQCDERESADQGVVYSEELLGKWCIVKYDQKPFPGMIQDLDETDVFVQCMHRVGHNRFFWPEPIQDTCWYPYTDVLRIVEPPKKVGTRHWQVEPVVWDEIIKSLD